MTKYLNTIFGDLTQKSDSKKRKQLGCFCQHVDCKDKKVGLTIYKGPGQDIFCLVHQLGMFEWAGMGRTGRDHTFSREPVCSECGKDVREIVRETLKRQGLTEQDIGEVKFKSLWCALMDGDHNGMRKADGGDDSKNNIKSLCKDCHSIKTMLNEDYLKGAKLAAV